MKKLITYLLLSVLLPLSAIAGPAGWNELTLHQPDGTSFPASIRGDEYYKIKTTLDGHFIIQEEDGWWCYGYFDSEGRRFSTGFHVGCDVPQAILSASLTIPFDILSAKAHKKRATAARNRMINRITTRSGEDIQDKSKMKGLIILAEFKDIKMRHTREEFEALIKEKDYSLNGGSGSALDYLNEQFNGMIDFEFDVTRVVTLGRDRSYYGKNDENGDDMKPYQMVIDACKALEDEIDFSVYDQNGDAEVDNIFVFFAGDDEADGGDEDCIWSHKWFIKDGAWQTVIVDGVVLNKYACSSELRRKDQKKILTGIGTFCHEYSHTFGLPDFYDTDYDDDGGWAAGLWKTSLMDTGNQNNSGNTPPYYNAIERELLGISDPVTLNTTGRYTLDPIDKNGTCYRIDTDQEGEYFLFECRAAEGWDKYIGGSGMLIYHIDRSNAVMERWDYYNTVNADHSHQCADLIEADGRKDSFGSMEEKANLSKSLSGVFFPYGSTTSFTPDGSPSFRFWSGAESPYALVSIKKENSVITFNLIEDGKTGTPPDAVNMSYEAFADAAIIRFESSYLFNGEAQAVWGRKDQEDKEITVTPYAPGKYSVTLEGLESSKTYNLKVTFILDGLEGNTEDISFMTKRMPDVDWPYIYLGSMERDSNGHFLAGGRFPMRVYNAADAAEIRWTFNGEKIAPEGDGYWTLKGNGTLQAVIIWEDGRRETVTKEIITGR